MINFDKIIKKGTHIDGDVYEALWNDFTKYDKVRCRKLEFLQTYAFIDEDKDYTAGKYKKFLTSLKSFHENAYGGKDEVRRIHYIEYPLDPYLEMEYYTYLINEGYGQDIRVTNKRDLFPSKVFDFVLFDNSNLFVLDMGNNDSWNGAWWITDKETIKQLAKWYDDVFEKSINFKNMMFPNKEIIDGMKKLGILSEDSKF